jgi:hypothetical protein
VIIGAVLLVSAFAFAAGPKSYQVTGPILEITDDTITVQKGKENWEIARDKETKVTGELKKGSKVTIHYQMKAVDIEVKEAKKEKPAKAETKTPPAKK